MSSVAFREGAGTSALGAEPQEETAVPGQKGCGRNTRALPEAITPGWFYPQEEHAPGQEPLLVCGAQRSGCCPKSHTGQPPRCPRDSASKVRRAEVGNPSLKHKDKGV